MIKVRIGNDIRLNITLKGTLDYDLANIKQIKCYFINTLMDDLYVPPFKTKRTFDRLSDPDTKVLNVDGTWYSVSEIDSDVINDARKFCPWHEPDLYHIDVCGPACYHYQPWNALHECMHDHWYFFDRRVRHNKPVPPHFGKWENDLNIAQLGNEPYYLAPCRILPEKNRIQVYFPAEQLYFCGTYKLVIKIVTYEAGWGPKNLRERTIEYPDILTIVDNSTGEDSDIQLEYDETGKPYTCSVVLASIMPPTVSAGNADTKDQSFESGTSTTYQSITGLKQFISDHLSALQTKDIASSSLTFNVKPYIISDKVDNYVWIVSQRPVYKVAVGTSNVASPLTEAYHNDNEYYYVIPNSIGNIDELKVITYFNEDEANSNFLGYLSKNGSDECDCESIPTTTLDNILNN